MGIFGNSNPYASETANDPVVPAMPSAPPMALQTDAPNVPAYKASGGLFGSWDKDRVALTLAGLTDAIDPLTMHPGGGGAMERLKQQQLLQKTQKGRQDAFNAAYDPATGKFDGKKFVASLAGGGVTPTEQDVKDYLTPQKPIDIGDAGYALNDQTGKYEVVIPKAPKAKEDYNIPGIGRFSGETNQPIVLEPGVTPTQAAAAQAAQPARGPAAPSGSAATGKFADFQANYLSKVEGGYAPSDGNGKPVNFGINQGANPDIDVANLTPEKASQVMHDRYWVPSGADKLPPGLAEVQADTAINMGIGPANRLLQQSGGDPQKYLQLRANRYQSIAAANPDKARLLPTWMARNQQLADYVGGGGATPAAAAAPAPAPGGPMTFTKASGHPSTAAELTSVGLKAGTPAWTGLDGKPVPYPASDLGTPDEAAMTKDSIDFQASTYLKNGVLPGLGNGKVAAQNKTAIINRATQIAKELNLSPEDFIAGTIGVKAAGAALSKATAMRSQIEGNEATVAKNADFALSLAPKGGGPTNVPVLNRFVQHVRGQYAGDPDVSAFNNAIGTVADEYAKVMTATTGAGGTSSDSARAEAYKRLSSSATIPQLRSNIAAMKTEMANRVDSMRNVEEGLRAQIRGGGSSSAPASASPPATSGGWGKAVVVKP